MIRKLKRKFILTNMLLVSLVLLAVFAVLAVSTSRQQALQSRAALQMALQWREDGPPRFEFGVRPPERDREEDERGDRGKQFTMVPAFSATVDADGTISARTGNNAAVTDETVRQAVEAALADGREEGKLSGLGLRFLLQREGETTHIAFADTTWERESLGNLLLVSLLVGAGALAVFFFISLFLARLSVRPVEQAWERQRRFVADASHELKTPLTVILANAGILLAHREDTVERQAKWVEYIREEAGRMKGLVEDMLFLAKSDAAREVLPGQVIDLSELAEGCLLPFESVAFEAGVTLEGGIAPGITVRGDEAQLRRLVLILLDNACKYAGEKGRVELTLARVQDRARLTVRNTGPAIPAEHLEHLFERFYRADASRARDAGGYGLGLAIAKSIVEGHKGKISVASAEGEGTAFTVTLPAGR